MPRSVLVVCDHCGLVLPSTWGSACPSCGSCTTRYVPTVSDRPPLRLIRSWIRGKPQPWP